MSQGFSPDGKSLHPVTFLSRCFPLLICCLKQNSEKISVLMLHMFVVIPEVNLPPYVALFFGEVQSDPFLK
jgi:hypothetical protein